MAASALDTTLALKDTVLRPYEYQPLLTPDSIRVLCLEPAKSENDTLYGSIIQYDRFAEIAKIRSRRKYCAVSYAWGVPEFTERLTITNQTRDGQPTILSITPGIKTMLQHFRKPDQKQYLWIDAICLNQSDQAEKMQQIPLMGEIYAQAYKSKFWLGVGNGLKAAKIFAYFRCSASMPSPKTLEKNFPFSSREEFASQVKTLLSRTWFSRRWILQEARLSRNATMWCGHHSVPYHVFVTACKNIVYGRYEIDGCLSNEYAVRSTYQVSRLMGEGNVSEDMCTLLWNFHESACSEERDRFGALYCLVPRDLQPTLDLGAPFPKIYEQFAVSQINVNSTSAHRLMLHILSFGSLHDSGKIGASSWTPDWSQKRRSLREDMCIHTIGHEPFYHARHINSSLINRLDQHHPHHRDVQYRWCKFLKNSGSEISKCTYLSAHYEADTADDGTESQDQNTTAVLRVRWFHPNAGRRGMTINSVAVVSNWLPGDELPMTFLQELQSMINNTTKATSLHSLFRFITGTTFHGNSYTEGMKTGLDACYTELLHYRSYPCDISSIAGGKLVLRIAELLHSRDLAILDWRHSDVDHEPMIALGPTDAVKGDCMIPLACSSMNRAGRSSSLWLHGGFGHWFENFIAIRPHQSSTECRSTDQDAPVEFGVRKGSFLGPCVAYFEEIGKSYDDVSHRVKAVELACKLVDGHPRPPPYVFDII